MEGFVTTPGHADQSLLEAHFPHIVQGLVTAWCDPKATEHFLESVTLDERYTRQGLPEEVFNDLMFLSDLNWKRLHFNDQGVEYLPDNFHFGGH